MSAASAANADRVAAELGITQRFVLDAVLEDAALVKRMAERAFAALPQGVRDRVAGS